VEVEQAISAGLRFLRSRQAEQGYWSDWCLPVGESRMWTTAYVGYRLSGLCSALETLERAANWLANVELPGGGWGYNEEAGADADSTALAILFLTAQGMTVEERSYQRLKRFQRAEGGFSTYTLEQTFGAWTESHVEITAVAMQALRGRDADAVRWAEAYVRTQETPERMWNSYWWDTPLYATEAVLRAMGGGKHFEDIEPRNSFERALLVLCLGHVGGDAERVAGDLVDAQLDDGSWPSTPVLRLPSRACSLPWIEKDSAPLFADQNRIFTSATVIGSLVGLISNLRRGC